MGQAHQTSVSLPHRRWQKAIRSVIRKINVRKITLKLYDIEMSHGLGLLSSSDDVGTTLQYASDEEHGSTSPLFFKLPSVTNLERDRSSLGEIFMDRPARSEDSAESSDLIPNITSFSEKASTYNKQKKSPDTKPLFLEYLKRRSQSNAQNFKSNTFKQKIVVSDSLSKDGKKLPSSTHSPTRARSLTMNHADAALFSPMFIRKSEDTSPVQRASSSEECYSPLKSLSPRLLQSGQDIALSSPRALLVKADSISPSMLPITVGTSIPPSLQQASVRASRDSGDIGLISVIEKSSSKTKFPTVHATKSETSDKVGKLQSIPLRRKSIKL